MSVNVSPSEVAAPATLPASIRAAGSLKLVVVHTDAGSAVEDVAESGPLRVRFPRIRGEKLEGILLNTAGGIAGGDRLSFSVEVAADAALALTSQAAEKIYRSNGLTSRISVALKVADDAELDWVPQETILFDRARVEREIEADVASSGRLTICEAIVLGREAMGESVKRGSLRDRWHIRREGRLIFADALKLEGEIDQTVSRIASMNSMIAMATLVCVVPDAEEEIGAVREAFAQCDAETGVSAFNGMLVARILAKDSLALRAAVLAALDAIGSPPPRAYSL